MNLATWTGLGGMTTARSSDGTPIAYEKSGAGPPLILVDGALWRARPCWEDDGPLRVGDHVVVERVKGLTLSVRRAEEWELET